MVTGMRMREEEVRISQKIGDWMKENGSAIYKCGYSKRKFRFCRAMGWRLHETRCKRALEANRQRPAPNYGDHEYAIKPWHDRRER